MAEQLISLAEKYTETFKVGAVDCGKQSEICDEEFENPNNNENNIIAYPAKGGRNS